MSLKIGIIGLGFVTQLAHLPVLHYNKKIKIISICDTNKKLAKKIANKYNIKKYYTSYEEMITKNKLDGVVLAVNRENTAEISEYVLKNKINLLTEKPSALNSNNAHMLTKIAKKNKCLYLTGYMKRFDNGINSLLNEIKKNKLGKLKNVYYEHLSGDSYAYPFEFHLGKTKNQIKKSSLNKKFSNKKNNYIKFLNTHCHTINMIRYLFGDIQIKKSLLDNRGEGYIFFQKKNISIILNNQYSNSREWMEKITFYFDGGVIKLNIAKPFLKNISSNYSIYDFKKNTNYKIFKSGNWCFKNQMDYFLNSINKKKKSYSFESYQDILLIEKIFDI